MGGVLASPLSRPRQPELKITISSNCHARVAMVTLPAAANNELYGQVIQNTHTYLVSNISEDSVWIQEEVTAINYYYKRIIIFSDEEEI